VKLRSVAEYPPADGGMIHLQSTLGHQFLEVPSSEAIPQVPSHAHDDHVILEVAASEQGRSGVLHRWSRYQTKVPSLRQIRWFYTGGEEMAKDGRAP
jgi:hypothetical protein